MQGYEHFCKALHLALLACMYLMKKVRINLRLSLPGIIVYGVERKYCFLFFVIHLKMQKEKLRYGKTRNGDTNKLSLVPAMFS